jgi:uncharacterized protein YkwD
MSASSATGRGPARASRRPAKIIRMPTPRATRRKRVVRIGAALLAIGLASAIGVHGVRVATLHTTGVATGEFASPLSAQEFRILKLVNDERVRAGQPPLQFSPLLMSAARAHSIDMAERRYFGHDSPAGDTPADRVRMMGISYEELAESLYRDDSSNVETLPDRVVKGWLASPSHRANMLSTRFRIAAVGIARSDDGKIYVTQDFIR